MSFPDDGKTTTETQALAKLQQIANHPHGVEGTAEFQEHLIVQIHVGVRWEDAPIKGRWKFHNTPENLEWLHEECQHKAQTLGYRYRVLLVYTVKITKSCQQGEEISR
jgi:hypothetical protein